VRTINLPLYSIGAHGAPYQRYDCHYFFEKLLLAGLAISLKPVAGTKLMQKDIALSIELPLHLAIVD